MGVKVKLTPAQKRELSAMAASHDGSCTATDDYKPICKLVEVGFATRRKSRSQIHNSTFTITNEGRRYLSGQE